MSSVKLFSVFIDQTMYRSFFELNPYLWPYECTGIDNRGDNLGLPALYNRVISQHLEDDCWLFFVHEDFEIRQSLRSILALDPGHVYGTFGVRMQGNYPVAYGEHTCSNKDGSEAVQVGLPITDVVQVSSLDCQSVLVHTSLLRQFPELRFDENLTFDLYAEDFSMQAQFHHGLAVYVFPLACQHFSKGRVTERYHRGLAYLAEKFPNEAVPGSCSFIGGNAAVLEKNFQYDITANPAKN